jgi:Uma2 family endonuclease
MAFGDASMSIVSTIKMTARQFLELGEDPPGVRLELVDGEVAVSPSPIPAHGYALMRLAARLVNHVEGNVLGRIYPDVDTIFGEHDVRRPDLLYFSKARLHLIGDRAMEGPPDLCVEVLSSSSRKVDRKDKFKQYEKAGVKCYWILDPLARTIEGFKLVGKRYRSTGKGKGNEVVQLPPFEDLDIPLGEIWQPRR